MKPSAAFSFTTASDGFTLIELTLVIVITGILAVFVAPRVIDINAWRIISFADQLQNATQVANRLAISQRKAIQVAYTTTGATITYVSGTLNGTAVINPTTNAAFNLSCPTGVSN
ncbi:MAG: prepilin-type N-terminal cleavage/methylation domain-containing protein, partial [Betaproteobacteria bacterium]|nr:prepilin-type N-terminal cleavage/methylation domain-containing protein [Betaproteobacteria bacterium]